MSRKIHPATVTKRHSPSMAGTQLLHRTQLRHHTDGPSLLELRAHGLGRIRHHGHCISSSADQRTDGAYLNKTLISFMLN